MDEGNNQECSDTITLVDSTLIRLVHCYLTFIVIFGIVALYLALLLSYVPRRIFESGLAGTLYCNSHGNGITFIQYRQLLRWVLTTHISYKWIVSSTATASKQSVHILSLICTYSDIWWFSLLAISLDLLMGVSYQQQLSMSISLGVNKAYPIIW
ncbi:predicted protein [Lichtheimia corymbifera JMRC:FSU:9682]|uniref:Uncharacterized protein n=1 Tax=Lichtheimia corymbifera JMRC:FSU:9682 TaxID=1263082 RepID=A0A068RUY6_9FUNG|nr:predicted protein [Lichtheimia corymbifera JMRC:FSU:9682]